MAETYAGTLLALTQVGGAAARLGAGAWSDRAKRRKPLIVSGYALAAGARALIAGGADADRPRAERRAR